MVAALKNAQQLPSQVLGVIQPTREPFLHQKLECCTARKYHESPRVCINILWQSVCSILRPQVRSKTHRPASGIVTGAVPAEGATTQMHHPPHCSVLSESLLLRSRQIQLARVSAWPSLMPYENTKPSSCCSSCTLLSGQDCPAPGDESIKHACNNS